MGGTVTLSRARPQQLGSDATRRWVHDLAEASRKNRELLGESGSTARRQRW
jgi:hypothetical protein